nr:nucleotide exchange factor GrpE [Candidatus Njordarchaeota archaeon]
MAPREEKHKTATAKKSNDQESEAPEKSDESGSHVEIKGSQVEVPVEEPHERELEELMKALEEEKNKAEQYLNSLKYLKAEFENYQKRTTKEMDELAKRGSERLARKLLAVVDDFERTIAASKAVAEPKKLLSGVEMILKELLKILKSEGIVKIEALGRKFDPELHEAVAVTRTDKHPADTVIEEQRPGYMFEGRVLRPSMVAVAKPPEKSPIPEDVCKTSSEEGTETRSDKDKGINKGA